MNDPGILAVVCAAVAAGALFSPSPAARRLAGILGVAQLDQLLRLQMDITAWARAVRARRQSRTRWRAAVIELCDGLGAELTAGRAPEAALGSAISVLDPQVANVLAAEWKGGSPQAGSYEPKGDSEAPVDVALDRLADRPGAEGLRLLASCWRIGAERGGTFAAVIEGLASALRDEEAQRQEVASQLAGPRATARLLAGLPLLGLAMAAALGADPLAFLFGTVPGAVCLVLGTGLDVLGLWWTARLAAAAEVRR